MNMKFSDTGTICPNALDFEDPCMKRFWGHHKARCPALAILGAGHMMTWHQCISVVGLQEAAPDDWVRAMAFVAIQFGLFFLKPGIWGYFFQTKQKINSPLLQLRENYQKWASKSKSGCSNRTGDIIGGYLFKLFFFLFSSLALWLLWLLWVGLLWL